MGYIICARLCIPSPSPIANAVILLLTRTRDCWSRMCSVLSRSISVRAPKSPLLRYFAISWWSSGERGQIPPVVVEVRLHEIRKYKNSGTTTRRLPPPMHETHHTLCLLTFVRWGETYHPVVLRHLLLSFLPVESIASTEQYFLRIGEECFALRQLGLRQAKAIDSMAQSVCVHDM